MPTDMTDHRPASRAARARDLLAALLLAGTPACVLAVPASAAATAVPAARPREPYPPHGNRLYTRLGNGKYNVNYSSIISPTQSYGFQSMQNASVNGRSTTQAGMCRRKHRVCSIRQKMWVSSG
ncbi:hypothetical protein Sru01_24130 [Sphaerisporangium rufum]|uniref:Endo-1,4-beta-xylanase n=1 Tax=Sphaerisporangium rufum TaxID=1381558 RepID=A0A919R2X8_9ACTN|nr:hypothetical protein [Sphaerisporangium rufum]GII77431.1 hypothetical protein Sru01_24130 [Sphaerisporangium rufum]